MTRDQLARKLRKSHRQTRSWKNTGNDFFMTKSMAYLIAVKKYDPPDGDIRARFHMGPRTCPTCEQRITVPRQVRKWRRLDDLSKNEILYLLATRTEMQ